MLIEFKINLKLSIICFVVFFIRNEKFLNVILGEQRTAQDSHDLHNGATEFEVVLNNTDETVRDDGDMYLDTYGICIGDSVEHRYLRNDIHLSMNLDTRLRASELCPAKDRHTEIDSCGVHSIESAMQLKLSRNSSLLRKNHHVECELFKDTIISEVVRLGECALVNGSLSYLYCK